MAKIYSFRKITDNFTTHTVIEPNYREDEERIVELCTIDGITYISVPDNIILSKQSEHVTTTLQEIVLTDELRKKINDVSPHCKLINQRTVENIRKKYSLNDEIQLLRETLADQLGEYNAYVEECVEQGKQDKEKLISSNISEKDSMDLS